MSWDGTLGPRKLRALAERTGLDVVYAGADHPWQLFVTADHVHGRYNTRTGAVVTEDFWHLPICKERWA